MFELAGASVAVVRPRVNARVRRLDSIFRFVCRTLLLCFGCARKEVTRSSVYLWECLLLYSCWVWIIYVADMARFHVERLFARYFVSGVSRTRNPSLEKSFPCSPWPMRAEQAERIVTLPLSTSPSHFYCTTMRDICVYVTRHIVSLKYYSVQLLMHRIVAPPIPCCVHIRLALGGFSASSLRFVHSSVHNRKLAVA